MVLLEIQQSQAMLLHSLNEVLYRQMHWLDDTQYDDLSQFLQMLQIKQMQRIPTNVFSAPDIGPSSAKPSAAIFLLSTVVIVGLLNKYVIYGTTNNIAMPGTIIAKAHKPQSKCTPNILAMKSPANALGAIAVKNIKDVTFVTM